MTSSAAPYVLAALYSIGVCVAPALAGPPSGWEPVPPEELARERSTIEPGADSEAIFWKVWVDDVIDQSGLTQNRRHYARIRVFTQAGAQRWSKVDLDVPYDGVQVHDIQARTIQRDGSIVPIDRKAVVKETIARVDRRQVRRWSFAMPAVQPGSIVEFRYRELRFDHAAMVQEYPLQFNFPLRQIAIHASPAEAEGWYVRQMFFHTSARSTPRRENGYYVTVLGDQKAYRAEPDSPPELQQIPWMLMYYTQEKLTSPNVFWPKFGRTRWEWFDDYSNPDKATKALAEQIAAGATSDAERVERLAAWVKREFRVVGRRPDYAQVKANRNANAAVRQRAGTDFDANAAFAALARGTGLEVRLLQAPTRTVFFFDPNMTSPSFLTATEVAVRIDGAWHCFDPSARYLPWDMVPWNEEAQIGLLCDRDSSRFIDTPVANPERSRIHRQATLDLSDDGALEGELTMTLSGHENDGFRSEFLSATQAIDTTTLARAGLLGPGVEVSRASVMSGEDDSPLAIRCRVRLPGHATVTGKRVILEPAAFHVHRPARFTASERRHPVYFEHAWSETDSIAIRIPKGWTVETVDRPEAVKAPGVAEYVAAIDHDPVSGAIVYRRSFRYGEQGALFVPAGGYGAVKRLFDLVGERDRVAVTLVRSEEGR